LLNLDIDLRDYDALLLDIDGTLLDHEDRLTPRTAAALEEVARRGIKVLLVTGRSIAGAMYAYRQLTLDTPMVCYDGQVIYDPADERWLAHHTVPDGLHRRILSAGRPYATFFSVYHEDFKYTVPSDDPCYRVFADIFENVVEVDETGLPASDITRVSFVMKPETLADFQARELPRLDGEVRFKHFPLRILPAFRDFDEAFVDLCPTGVSKAVGLDFIEEAYGIAPERAIAVGDWLNDLPMIERAGLGVAMANAHEKLREAAGLVIPSHREDGLAAFLEALLAGPGAAAPSGAEE